MAPSTDELTFNDTLSLLATDATAAVTLETHLATSLRKFFSLGELKVIWVEDRVASQGKLLPNAAGARSSSVTTESVPMTSVELTKVLSSATFNAPEKKDLAPSRPPSTSDWWGIDFARSNGPHSLRAERLFLRLGKCESHPRWPIIERRLGWFENDTRAQNSLFSTFSSLKATERQYRVMMRLQSLSSVTGTSARDRLHTALGLLYEIDSPMLARDQNTQIKLAIELAEAVVQETLGTGLDIRPLPSASAAVVEELGRQLLQLAADTQSQATESAPLTDLRSRLKSLAEILLQVAQNAEPLANEDLINPTVQDPNGSKRIVRPRQRLKIDQRIASWTQIFHNARRFAGHHRQNEAAEAQWKTWAQQEVAELGALLQQWNLPEIDTRDLPAWLRLWFCHELLWHTVHGALRQRKIVPSQKWRFRSYLAYVIRECLRGFNYGHRTDYMFQTAPFITALRNLVEQHALWVLEIPRFLDVCRLLKEIGQTRASFGQGFASGHLQHALEVYVAGYFISSIELRMIPKTQPHKTLASELAGGLGGPAGPSRTQQFQRAFGLAALLHDVGLVLLPRTSPHQLAEIVDDTSLRDLLHQLETNRGQQLAKFLHDCRKELETAGYLKSEEAGLDRWLRRVADQGEPDHCLIGAWYLHRLCSALEGFAEDSETVRQIVRATLLHRIPTQKINFAHDPAAGLLVLCDELFDWVPSHQRHIQLEQVGRTFYSLAADVRPQPSRFRRIRVQNLIIRQNKKGRVVPCLRLKKDQATCFELTFQEHEYLNQPIYQLWLAMSQNLERLQSSSGSRWTPEFLLRSMPSRELTGLPLSTHELLTQAAERCTPTLRPRLLNWLTARIDRFPEMYGDVEAVRLRCLGDCWHTDDIRHSLHEIDQAVADVHAEHRPR